MISFVLMELQELVLSCELIIPKSVDRRLHSTISHHTYSSRFTRDTCVKVKRLPVLLGFSLVFFVESSCVCTIQTPMPYHTNIAGLGI
jgi:hypothetical protein